MKNGFIRLRFRIGQPDLNDAFGQVIAQGRSHVRAAQGRMGETDLRRFQRLHGALGVDVEIAQGNQLFVLPLGAQRAKRVPRKDIDDGTADAELAAALHLRFAGIPGFLQLMENFIAIESRIFDQRKAPPL